MGLFEKSIKQVPWLQRHMKNVNFSGLSYACRLTDCQQLGRLFRGESGLNKAL